MFWLGPTIALFRAGIYEEVCVWGGGHLYANEAAANYSPNCPSIIKENKHQASSRTAGILRRQEEMFAKGKQLMRT